MRLTRYPSLTPLISGYVQGILGPHWEQPGRSILDDHLRRIPAANDVAPNKWVDESRLYFTGALVILSSNTQLLKIRISY